MFWKHLTKHNISMHAALLAGTLLLAACAPAAPAAPKGPTNSAETVLTQAASTAYAQLTETAAKLPPTEEKPQAPADTPVPPTATLAQPAPTQPPAATNTPVPPAKPTAAPAQDSASFVADVTVPDGTAALPGATFEKTWRIKNTGKTTWTAAYSLVYIDGERMGAPDKVDIPKEVRPDETVDITVKLTAPQKAGTYQTFFRLRNASNQFFKLDGTGDLWVKILVGSAVTNTPATTTTPDGNSTPTVTPTNQNP